MQKLINRCLVHLASVVKPSVVQTGVCLLCITTLFACSSDDGGASSGGGNTPAAISPKEAEKENEAEGGQCLQIPKTLTQGTGNLAIFNSLDEDVLLSYSSSLNADDVMAVIGGKQNGVKVDISQRSSSTVMVFGFKMPAVKDYLKADCDETKMPTAFVQSEFIPTAESSFVLEASEMKQDYGTLLILNKRSGLVSIFQGSSRNKQIGVVQAGQSNYRIQIPIGYKQLVFYLHKASGGIDFTKPVFSKNLVFNKGDTKLVFIPNKTIFNGAKIKFLNASAQDVMLMVRKSDSPLSNVECSCEVVGKESAKPVMILVQDKYYSADFFFSVISLDTGQTLTESQPFELDKKTNVQFELKADLSLKKTDLGKNQVVVPNEKPSTPSEVKTSEVKASSVKVSWLPSADSDGQVEGYEVSYKTSSGSWTGTQTTTQTSLIVSGLQPETSYAFRIRAKDDEGDWSAYEESQPVKTPEAANQPPSKPSTISTSQVTDSSIKVSWTAATDSDGSISGYEISYQTGNGFWKGARTITGTTYTFYSLQSETSYTFRIRAKDNDGQWSAYQQSTQVKTLAPPSKPSNISTSNIQKTSIKLSWTAATDSDGVIAGYEVSYKTGNGAWTGTQTTTQTSLIVSGLQPNTAYTFRIRARDNHRQWGEYLHASAKTLAPPSKPSTISTSNIQKTSIKVSWTAATDSDGVIAGYEVSYKTGNGSWTGTQTTTQTNLTVSGLQPNTAYTFRIRAKDNHGQWSDYQQSSAVKTDLGISKYTWKQIKANDNTGWSKRLEPASVVFDGKLWVLGGYDGSKKNDVWSSTDGQTWKQVTSSASWSVRDDHTSVVFNSKLWVLGGGSHKNDVWSSSDGKNWTEHKIPAGKTRWSARNGHTVVAFNGKLWVMGGEGGVRKNDVWSSSDGQTWTQVTPSASWSVRDDHTSVVFDGKLWVLGGYDGNSRFNDAWSSSDGKNWTEHKIPLGKTRWSRREDHTSVVFDSKLWVMGGTDGGTKNDVWSSPDGVNWTKVTDAAGWSTRLYHISVVFKNKIWVLGGGATSSNRKNDVWAFGP